MDKVKKYFSKLIILILVLSPLANLKVFAATTPSGGWLQGLPGNYSNLAFGSSVGSKTNITDGNMGTQDVIDAIDHGFYTNLNNNVWWNLSEAANISSFFIATNSSYTKIHFKHADGTITDVSVGTSPTGNLSSTYAGGYSASVTQTNVVAVDIENLNTVASNYYEFDVYGTSYAVTHNEIKNLSLTPGNNSMNLSYSIPTGNGHFVGSNIYRNGTLIKTQSSSATSFTDTGLNMNTSYTYKVTALYDDGIETSGVSQTAKTLNPPAGDVSLLSAATTKNEVDLSWENPTDSLFANKVNIYRDGVKIGESTGTTFTDTNVNPGTGYNYTVKTMSIYGAESKGTSLIVATPLDEVGNVKAVPNWNNVALSWDNPNDPLFAGVTIYRDGVKIGESTGTTYTDSSVNPETKYTYTIKAISTNLTETNGISLQTTTLKEPLPVLTGATGTKTDNGDFLFTWDTPTTGTVKVLVGGTLYQTVDASLQKIIIPSSDMKYDMVGNPEVTLVPVSTTGLEGKTYNPDTASIDTRLPIGANDLLGAGKYLLWIIAPILLLSLAFLLVPKLRNLMFGAIKGKKIEKETDRRTESENEQPQEKEEENKENEILAKTVSKDKKEKRKEKDIREERLPRELRKELEERKLKRKLIGEIIKSDKPEKESRVKAHKKLRQPRERIREGRSSQRQKRESRESTRITREPRRRNR